MKIEQNQSKSTNNHIKTIRKNNENRPIRPQLFVFEPGGGKPNAAHQNPRSTRFVVFSASPKKTMTPIKKTTEIMQKSTKNHGNQSEINQKPKKLYRNQPKTIEITQK